MKGNNETRNRSVLLSATGSGALASKGAVTKSPSQHTGRLLKNGFSLPLADARGSVTHSKSARTFLSRDCKGAIGNATTRLLAHTARKAALIQNYLPNRDCKERHSKLFFQHPASEALAMDGDK